MHFPDRCRVVPAVTQNLRKCWNAGWQCGTVTTAAMLMRIQNSQQRIARRAAHNSTAQAVLIPHTLRRYCVNIRGLDIRVSGHSKAIVAMLVAIYQQNIGCGT